MTPSFFLHRIQPEQIPSDSFSSLDASDTDSERCAYLAEVKPQPFVRQDREALQAMSDETLRKYEGNCFLSFQTSRTRAEKDEWVHAMAAALVELSNRHLSLSGAK